MSRIPQRLNVSYRILWESDWHSGSGEGSAGVDRKVRRRKIDGSTDAQPFIPGSQLKGVLRHQCERLSALLNCEVVSPHHIGGSPSPDLLGNFQPLIQSKLLIDRLFGSRYQGECLFVDDALPVKPMGHPTREHSRTAMDRLTGIAREHTLFVSEVTVDRQALVGKIRARHPAGVLLQFDGGFPLEYSLLLAGLRSINSLGADRSTGLGMCRIEIAEEDGIQWNDKKITVEEALTSFGEGWDVVLELAMEEKRQ